MNNSVKVLGIIPARGNSKGIPKKNIYVVAGRPLIAYTIEAALKSKLLSDIVVSSEDRDVCEIARSCGARVPFIRPAELSEDSVLMPPVIIDAIEWLIKNEGLHFDLVFVLLPTAPLRTELDIDNCIRLFVNNQNAGSLLAVTKVEDPHPWKMKIVRNGWLKPLMDPASENTAMRRQDCPPVYAPCGAAILARTEDVLEQKKLLCPPVMPYFMPPERAINIDTEMDLLLASRLIKNKIISAD